MSVSLCSEDFKRFKRYQNGTLKDECFCSSVQSPQSPLQLQISFCKNVCSSLALSLSFQVGSKCQKFQKGASWLSVSAQSLKTLKDTTPGECWPVSVSANSEAPKAPKMQQGLGNVSLFPSKVSDEHSWCRVVSAPSLQKLQLQPLHIWLFLSKIYKVPSHVCLSLLPGL
jgi:hypothetical protein